MMKEIAIKIQLTDELMGSLTRGKNITYNYPGNYRVDIYPPQHGIFLSWSEYEQIKMYSFGVGAFEIFDRIENKRLNGDMDERLRSD